MAVTYSLEPELAAEEFIDLLIRSTLAERRPVHDIGRITAMIRNADIIATARSDGRLVGVLRAVSDFAYCVYLSELAVDGRACRGPAGRAGSSHHRTVLSSETGAPLTNARILVPIPGTESPAISLTARDGRFSISATTFPARLSCSKPGFGSRELSAAKAGRLTP
jgi:hypothetical protein